MESTTKLPPSEVLAYLGLLVSVGKSGIITGPSGIGKTDLLDRMIDYDEKPGHVTQTAVIDDTSTVGKEKREENRMCMRRVRGQDGEDFEFLFSAALGTSPDTILVNKMRCQEGEDRYMKRRNMRPRKNPKVYSSEGSEYLQDMITRFNETVRSHGIEDRVCINETVGKEVTVVATMDSPGIEHAVGTLALNGTLDCWKWIAAFKQDGRGRMRLDSAFEVVNSNGSPRLIHVCRPGDDVPLHGILHRTHHLTRNGRFANIEDLHVAMRKMMPIT